jgi:hypothetical protein
MLENDPFADIPPSLTIPIEPPIKFENRNYDLYPCEGA